MHPSTKPKDANKGNNESKREGPGLAPPSAAVRLRDPGRPTSPSVRRRACRGQRLGNVTYTSPRPSEVKVHTASVVATGAWSAAFRRPDRPRWWHGGGGSERHGCRAPCFALGPLRCFYLRWSGRTCRRPGGLPAAVLSRPARLSRSPVDRQPSTDAVHPRLVFDPMAVPFPDRPPFLVSHLLSSSTFSHNKRPCCLAPPCVNVTIKGSTFRLGSTTHPVLSQQSSRTHQTRRRLL